MNEQNPDPDRTSIDISTPEGKVLPPRAPVSVPNPPPRPDADTPDEAALQSRPEVNHEPRSNWSDNSRPLPQAKRARTSIL